MLVFTADERAPMTRPTTLVAAVLLGLSLAPGPSWAQTKIEEVERKLEEAKERKRREGQRPPAPASAGRLVVRTNGECELAVNGTKHGVLAADAAKTLSVTSGQQLVECSSVGEVRARFEQIIDVKAGTQLVVLIDVAGELSRAADARAKADAAKEKSERDARAKEDALRVAEGGYVSVGSGVVRDPRTQRLWTDRDEKAKSWSGAVEYCQRFGPGWGLPTATQLRELIDATRTRETNCGYEKTCYVSAKFKLKGPEVWTSDNVNYEFKKWSKGQTVWDYKPGKGVFDLSNGQVKGRVERDDNVEYALCTKDR